MSVSVPWDLEAQLRRPKRLGGSRDRPEASPHAWRPAWRDVDSSPSAPRGWRAGTRGLFAQPGLPPGMAAPAVGGRGPPVVAPGCNEKLHWLSPPGLGGQDAAATARSGQEPAQSVRKGTEMSQQEAGESKKSWPVLQTRRVLSTLLSKRLVVTCTERHGPAGPRGEGALGPAPPPPRGDPMFLTRISHLQISKQRARASPGLRAWDRPRYLVSIFVSIVLCIFS